MKILLTIACCFAFCSLKAQENKAPLPTEGMASYYHDKFEGRSTASGELYRKDSLTAAHRTLPFNTRIEVINLENDNSVVVRVNDRGPQIRTRIIDVSRAAAEILDFVQEGVTRVRIRVIEN